MSQKDDFETEILQDVDPGEVVEWFWSASWKERCLFIVSLPFIVIAVRLASGVDPEETRERYEEGDYRV